MRRADADLYVMPEMFDTGFVVEPEDCLSPHWSAETLEWMKSMAEERKAAVCGSVATRVVEDGVSHWRNRMYFVRPEGEGGVVHYDKHHLFEYGGEAMSYNNNNVFTIGE